MPPLLLDATARKFEVSSGYLGRPITPWTWEASAALIFYLSDRNIATGITLASIKEDSR
jgi:hypothetical protein